MDATWIRNRLGNFDAVSPDVLRAYVTVQNIDDWTVRPGTEEEWAAAFGPALPDAPASVEVPALALTVSREQAAALLSISVDHFERHVLPAIRVVQSGRRQLVPVRELEDFVNSRAARALKG